MTARGSLGGRYVAVSGTGRPGDRSVIDTARRLGSLLAERGAVVVTGGLGGAMGAAADGVRAAGGTAVALLPGRDRAEASPGHDVVLATGMGEMRNALLVRCVDAVVAVGGSWGTLSEVALAARTGVPVVTVGLDLPSDLAAGPEVRTAGDADEAVALLEGLLRD